MLSFKSRINLATLTAALGNGATRLTAWRTALRCACCRCALGVPALPTARSAAATWSACT